MMQVLQHKIQRMFKQINDINHNVVAQRVKIMLEVV